MGQFEFSLCTMGSCKNGFKVTDFLSLCQTSQVHRIDANVLHTMCKSTYWTCPASPPQSDFFVVVLHDASKKSSHFFCIIVSSKDIFCLFINCAGMQFKLSGQAVLWLPWFLFTSLWKQSTVLVTVPFCVKKETEGQQYCLLLMCAHLLF